jgi:Kdo2-lipid IVA lauroyltransferase/acyltransferase
MAAPLHKSIKRAVRSFLIRQLLRVLGLLPLGPALALGGAAGRLAHRLAGGTRRLALTHLAQAFPEKTPAEREAIARDMFVHLGRSATELASVRWYDRRLDQYVEVTPPRLLAEVMGRGRGMVFVTGHLGSWELLARRIARAGVPNAVIAKSRGDRALNAMAERFRAAGGVTTLWREDPDTGRAIIRTFRSGKALGILIDQDTRVQGVFVPFFGRLAFTPRAAADFAIRFGAPVVVGTIHRKGPRPADGHLLELTEVSFSSDPPDREVEAVRLTAACTAILEDAIRRHPGEWVWMHERWRTRPADERAAVEMPAPSKVSAENR